MVRDNPKEDEIRYVLAEAHEQAGQFFDAERILSELRDRAAKENQAKLLQAAQQVQSQTPSEKAPPSPVENTRPLRALAGLYERAGKLNEAALAFEDVLRVDPQSREALFALNTIRTKQNRPGATAEYLERLALVEETEPNLPAIGALRQLHVANQTLSEYESFTQRMLAKYPENKIAQYIRGRAITDENPTEADRKEAVGLFKRILDKSPNDTESRFQLATQYEALNQKAEALAAYEAVVRISPGNTQAQEAVRRLKSQGTGSRK
jgi:cytochrome c-type biogenesis protein CcmH/NrfG